MLEKKQLNQEELEKVSGGALDDYEIGKFYCYCSALEKAADGTYGVCDRLGPYDTENEAKENGKEWAINKYNNGYVCIHYSSMKWDYCGWRTLNEFTYPE